MSKKGILLINLGTPNSYKIVDVRKYLREFLMDKYENKTGRTYCGYSSIPN